MPAPIIVFLHEARYDRVHQAVSLVNTASRMGRRAYLCLFYDALGSFIAGSWDSAGAVRADDDAPPWRAALARWSGWRRCSKPPATARSHSICNAVTRAAVSFTTVDTRRSCGVTLRFERVSPVGPPPRQAAG